MKDLYIRKIASVLGVKEWQVENTVQLFADGATVPFISRYRKERTGSLDEVAIAQIKHLSEDFDRMDKRKQTILETISAAGALTPELQAAIESSVGENELEDLYLPYRPKRRTRATAAREAGYEPLADLLWNNKSVNPLADASRFADPEAALAGARDIVAERIAEMPVIREAVRRIFRTRRIVSKKARNAPADKADKYRNYMDYSESLSHIAPHRLLAILRAGDEGVLSIGLDSDAEKCCKKIYYEYCQVQGYPGREVAGQIQLAVKDCFDRLLEPSISSEIIREAKRQADLESIRIFGENLRQLLLAAPVGQKRTLAIDPGFRTGCKVVCLDAEGNLLHYEAIFPHPPANEKVAAMQTLSSLISDYRIEVIAIGNGTASRETEEFVKRVPRQSSVKVFVVSEDGASIYSASDVAREEFPEYDVTVRGAVSIGRRLMDPLAELVKIDPKSLGVGQYQYDVDQGMLRDKLDDVVESCVNSVGVNLNTASRHLLAYVSGIGPALAENIVEYRRENGAYTSRDQLLKVKRLGASAYQQCAGFLRIRGAANPLDNSAVHPESYHIVSRMAASLGVGTEALVGNPELCSKIRAEDFVEAEFGLPTINDILKELAKPGRDPREEARTFEFAADVHGIEDLKAGMKLPGIVTNITAFGAFVDIGIKQNGLIHVSQMSLPSTVPGRRVRVDDPSKVVKLHQQVMVTVLSVDTDRQRIALKL